MLISFLHLAAQSGTGTISGSVRARDISSASNTRPYSVNGATVMLVSGADTVYATTINGVYQFRRVKEGKAALQFRFVGYSTEDVEVEVKAGQTTYRNIELKEASTEIETVAVTATVPPMKKSGDTLVYNPLAVRTLEGDAAEEILKQMPGVEMEDGAVSVLGKAVDRVYVDGRLLFGEGVMTALQNIKASDVLKIKSFDEHSEETQRSGRKQDEQRRVLNIETKSKLISATTGHLLGSLGADFSRNADGGRQERYAAGMTLNYFSDNLEMGINAITSNINRSSNRMNDILAIRASSPSYNRDNSIDFEIVRKWRVKIPEKDTTKYTRPFEKRLNFDYAYNDRYSRSASLSNEQYFPSAKFDSMINYDTTRNTSTSASHTFNLRFTNNYRGLRFSSRANLWERGNEAYRGSENIFIKGGTTTSSIGSNTTENSSYGYDLNESARWSQKGFAIGADFGFSDSDGKGWRVDTLVSKPTDTKIWLRNGSEGFSREISAYVNQSFNIINTETRGLYLWANYDFSYDKTLARQIAVDRYTGLVDTINTSDYYSSTNTHTANASVSYYIRNKLNLRAALGYQSRGINRDESFPEDYVYDKRFNSLMPSVNLDLGEYMGNMFSVGYSTSVNTPSINQLRPRINDSNKMRLSVGNPDLDQSRTHNIRISYKWLNSAKGRESNVGANYSITSNGILSRSTVFAQDTLLALWDYEATQGSTLTTYENINGQMNLSGNWNHSRYISSIKSKFNYSLRMNYTQTPSYVDQVLVNTDTYAPSLALRLEGNFSRQLNFSLSSNGTYRYTENSHKDDDESLNLGLGANMRWDVNKWFFVNANYSYSKYLAYSGYSQDNESQVLNAVAGFKLFNRRCDLAVAAYDILGHESNFSSSVSADHITNTWRQTFGRFFLVNIGYRINATRGPGGRNEPAQFIIR